MATITAVMTEPATDPTCAASTEARTTAGHAAATVADLSEACP